MRCVASPALSSAELYADPDLIERVFANLIGNAVVYVPEGRRREVEITGQTEGERICYAVTDNGIGIAPEFADVIFTPLRRLKTSLGGQAASGDGIGLSLVKTIIESHGGTIWLDTDYEGEGSRFRICLPANTQKD